ncbi:PREDICTED: G-type lectin S-receptor-like serine/threonine-protein kinase At2g19130 [Nicotiana attenuata]|uniref:G-type lectin S-receptor-like serine/threonine-protein kinase At2g19130 n=1 Tax=Nicotiana attenuata TaxID=49451 RepID=UPI000905794C|nr:PREDICTED: G-type lectin S-receptor-like serine/threonine-protein kinase At2g19130 [Nicotiana attenuata]
MEFEIQHFLVRKFITKIYSRFWIFLKQCQEGASSGVTGIIISCNNTSSDALLPGSSLSFSGGDTLVSKLGKFELGFFCPDTLKQRVWSTNVSIASKEDVNRAVLLDSGNLVLTNGIEIKWQSFDYPTDTWLPGARIGFDKSKNTLQKLTSWRNMNDPATGKYSLQLDQNQNGELVLLDNRGENWRSGPWDEGGVLSVYKM